jgi:hypothetical protein
MTLLLFDDMCCLVVLFLPACLDPYSFKHSISGHRVVVPFSGKEKKKGKTANDTAMF